MYSDDDMLMLSGIQHYRFCPRQWALIHVEQQWNDNGLTIEGQLLHKHVDDPFYRQKCGDHIALRSVNIASKGLGLYGICDMIELVPSDDVTDVIGHPKYHGNWIPVPIEYKHGKPKKNDVDEVQLVAQAMCLEEMYSMHIAYGAFFYAEIRHRVEVEITPRLRAIASECAEEMHKLYQSRRIPIASKGKHCERCSLKDICMPEVNECAKVGTYLKNNLLE